MFICGFSQTRQQQSEANICHSQTSQLFDFKIIPQNKKPHLFFKGWVSRSRSLYIITALVSNFKCTVQVERLSEQPRLLWPELLLHSSSLRTQPLLPVKQPCAWVMLCPGPGLVQGQQSHGGAAIETTVWSVTFSLHGINVLFSIFWNPNTHKRSENVISLLRLCFWKNTTTLPSWLSRVIAHLCFSNDIIVSHLNLFLIWGICQTTAPDLLSCLLISDLIEAKVEVAERQIDCGGLRSLRTLPGASNNQ